ncbi:MAG: ribosome recycling factor [Acutalibacteraceae bacterium]|jgi:ribosome recycling factor
MKQVFQSAEEKMNKTVSALENEYTAIRAGRANPAVLNKLTVDYYGAPTPVNQLASISVPEPRTLMVTPYDKSVLKEIEKAIQTSDVGINPQNDGSTLRLIFPPLTEERRKELGKTVQKYAEEAKVSIRTVRRDAMDRLKDLKKKSEITEDDLKDAEKKVQDLTDKFCKEIDGIAAKKEKEIMEI